MSFKNRYLFKGLNDDEIERGRLIPKGFRNSYTIIIPNTNFQTRSLNFSTSKAESIRHQYYNKTAGVSTSKSYDVAVKYATRYGTKDGRVAIISREKLVQYQINEFDAELFGAPEKQTDQEVILYCASGGFYFPKDIIVKHKKVKANDYKWDLFIADSLIAELRGYVPVN